MCKTDSKDGQDLVDHSMEKFMYYLEVSGEKLISVKIIEKFI